MSTIGPRDPDPEKLERWAEALVAKAPPFTDEQAARLAQLLRPTAPADPPPATGSDQNPP